MYLPIYIIFIKNLHSVPWFFPITFVSVCSNILNRICPFFYFFF